MYLIHPMMDDILLGIILVFLIIIATFTLKCINTLRSDLKSMAKTLETVDSNMRHISKVKRRLLRDCDYNGAQEAVRENARCNDELKYSPKLSSIKID